MLFARVPFALHATVRKGRMSSVTPGLYNSKNKESDFFFPVSITGGGGGWMKWNKNGFQNIFNQICLVGFVVLLMSDILQPSLDFSFPVPRPIKACVP